MSKANTQSVNTWGYGLIEYLLRLGYNAGVKRSAELYTDHAPSNIRSYNGKNKIPTI